MWPRDAALVAPLAISGFAELDLDHAVELVRDAAVEHAATPQASS